MFLSPKTIIQGYKKGKFPMSESRDDPFIFWVSPEQRGIINLNKFRIPRSLKKIISKSKYQVLINKNFKEVIHKCASPNNQRDNTWINDQIISCYSQLFYEGVASSVECYDGIDLIGGLYGVHIGKIFFGESMFSLKTNASKIALVYLAALLKEGGFTLIDTQFLTEHLKQFGCVEVKKEEYLKILSENINHKTSFPNKLKNKVLYYFN